MKKTIIPALLAAPILTTGVNAQSFIGESINSAVEAVQEGLDLIWPDELLPDDVNARLGVGFGLTPDYVGSDDYRLRVIPLIDVRYKDKLRLNGSLLTYRAKRWGNLEVGPLLNLRMGRDEDRNPILEGMGDIKTTFEVGAFARYKTKAALFSVHYRHGLGSGIKSSIRLTAGHGVYKSESGRFTAMVAARGRWLSKGSMQTEFGVTAQQAANSARGVEAFSAGAGFSEVSLNLVGAYEVNDRFRLLSLLSYGHLLGDAKDSPLTRGNNGSASQLVAGAGFAVRF